MNKRIIGIDLAVTAAHKAVVYDTQTEQFITPPRSFRATPTELEREWQRAVADAPAETEVVVILEATHMTWYPVGLYFHLKGASVYRVNGQKTKALRSVTHKFAGSDRIDCRVLVKLYCSFHERLHRWRPELGAQLALQRACRRYAQWRELDVGHQNRMSALDQLAWGGLHKVVPAIAKRWMRTHWYNPWHVVAAGLDQLTDAWHAVAAEKDASWIARWVARAQQRVDLYQAPQWAGFDYLQADVHRLQKERNFFRSQCDDLDAEVILPLYQRLYPDDQLPSILGIGQHSAAVYHAFIHDIDRFPNAAHFRRWTGLVPASHQSGDLQAKGNRISQAGPALIRATLFLNANVARQWDCQLAHIYHRQMVTFGKHHTQAVCAVATHLANRIFVILKQKRPFVLQDLDGNPISRDDSRQLCLTRFRVPDEVRKRVVARTRRQQHESLTEARYRRKQLRR